MRIVAVRHAIVVASLALAACSDPGSRGATTLDVNEAAAAAQGDIDTYAANTLAAQRPAARPRPEAPPAPAPAADDAGGAPVAAAVVRRYLALVAARRDAPALALWADARPDREPDRAAFAAGLAGYAEYRTTVGPPGRVEAGAGQRYVRVPVRASGILAEGQQPFVQQGVVTLRRSEVDGATAAQRRWRIMDAAWTPPPAATPASPAVVSARYECAGATRISVRFDNAADTATVRQRGRDVAVMQGQRPGSGIWYKGGGYELRGKGDAAEFTVPGAPPVACTARD